MSGRYISVKRTGRFHAEPDTTVIVLELSAAAPKYEDAMLAAEEKIDIFRYALKEAGLDHAQFTTTNFTISRNYESSRDALGNYRRRRNGFICKQELQIEFEFDVRRLSAILWAVSRCGATPDFPIVFSVRKNGAMSQSALDDAVEKARVKAELLAKACGVKLGKLVKVNYDVKDVYKPTKPQLSSEDIFPAASAGVNVEDTVTFIWAIDQ